VLWEDWRWARVLNLGTCQAALAHSGQPGWGADDGVQRGGESSGRGAGKGLVSAHWFSITSVYKGQTVDDVVTLLSPLGISLHPPAAQPYCYRDELGYVLRCIGELTVYADDGIVAAPHEQLSERHVRTLLGAAEEAFLHPPTAETRWEHHRVKASDFWSCEVMLPERDEAERTGRLIARDHHVKAARITR
jgi:hypothetical protein